MISSASSFTSDYLVEAITSKTARNGPDLLGIGAHYPSRDLALADCDTLAAGYPDAEPEV
jgi:hypothetical protein